MQTPKIFFDTCEPFMIDITRRCNLSCRHCMRGEAADRDISPEIIDCLLDQTRGFDTLTLSGGEPLLADTMIAYIVDGIIKRNIFISALGLVTNGTIVSEVAAEALQRMKAYRLKWVVKEGKEQYYSPTVGISISNDEFHREQGVTDEQRQHVADFFTARGIETDIREQESNTPFLIRMGRAESLTEFVTIPQAPPHRIMMDYETHTIKCPMELDAVGRLFADRVETNNSMEMCLASLATTNSWKDIWSRCERWNMQYPITCKLAYDAQYWSKLANAQYREQADSIPMENGTTIGEARAKDGMTLDYCQEFYQNFIMDIDEFNALMIRLQEAYNLTSQQVTHYADKAIEIYEKGLSEDELSTALSELEESMVQDLRKEYAHKLYIEQKQEWLNKLSGMLGELAVTTFARYVSKEEQHVPTIEV